MNIAELIYKLVEFFFSYFWHFVALVIYTLILQGHPAKMFAGVGRFVEGVKARYKARVERQKSLATFDTPELVKDFQREQEEDGKSKN